MAKIMEVIEETKALLGEGPLWLADRKQLIWVDIESKQIHLLTPSTGEKRVITVDQRIGTIAPVEDGRMLCALQNGLYFLDINSEQLELITDPEAHLPNNRFNDGKCDPSGRFWAGTMPLGETIPSGALYRLDHNGAIHQMVTGVGCSNGMAWSQDQTTMYYIDTYTGQVDRFDYEAATGAISNRKAIIVMPQEQGYPDGMTIDAEGMLWIAHWGGYCVSRWNPATGECLERVELPVSQVTSCCFGGEQLDELYITSARTGLSEEQLAQEPLAGSLFKYKPGVKGTPMYAYKCEA